MKTQILSVLCLLILVAGFNFSCNKKEDTSRAASISLVSDNLEFKLADSNEALLARINSSTGNNEAASLVSTEFYSNAKGTFAIITFKKLFGARANFVVAN